MNIYEQLNISPTINAAGTYTIVGGSRMSAETLQAMKEASEQHVIIVKLQEAVQSDIASMTHNEASVVCNGAAAGLYLCALSAIALKHHKKSRYLAANEIKKSEILAMSAQHIPYDYALRQLGVKQTWVGYPNIPDSMSVEDLENGITEDTAALFYYISSPYGIATPGVLSLQEFIQVGQRHNLPIVVDAAAQLPPVSNLWNFTREGATAVTFSGGKDICGPQSSGLIVGQKAFLDIVKESNFPHYGFGRMLKIGREEIVGLYVALKQYLARDHEQRNTFAENCVRTVLEHFSTSALYDMERVFPNEAGQPMAFVAVRLKKNIPLERVADEMFTDNPSVFIKPEGDRFFINPMTLQESEIDSVITKLKIVEKKILKK